ncbi:MAG: preprotein translocase subunit SecG [Pseudomonadota bacterium]|nr:preprotein translocase subunit SecG [Pseudomonadota bacterium]
MIQIVLVIHVIIAVTLIGVVLLQKSEGGALGIGGGGGVMSGRGAANLLTRSTAILATLFFVSSITLAILAGNRGGPESIITQPIEQPARPAGPSVPTSD